MQLALCAGTTAAAAVRAAAAGASRPMQQARWVAAQAGLKTVIRAPGGGLALALAPTPTSRLLLQGHPPQHLAEGRSPSAPQASRAELGARALIITFLCSSCGPLRRLMFVQVQVPSRSIGAAPAAPHRYTAAAARATYRRAVAAQSNGTPAAAVPEPVVKIDNETDPFATVVTIEFGNRLGELLDTVGAGCCLQL